MILLFQPAEEAGNGAKRMIGDNALEDVEAIFAVHVSHEHPTGMIGSRTGPLLAGCGFFRAVITGRNGPPRDSADPLLAASAAIISLQGIVSREANPLDSQVPPHFVLCFFFFFCLNLSYVSFIITKSDFLTQLQVVSVTTVDGGDNLDAMPDNVVIGGTFRAFSNDSFYQILRRIEEVYSDSTYCIYSMYIVQLCVKCEKSGL